MRTTINLDDRLLEEIKRIGVERRVSVSTVVNEALKQALFTAKPAAQPETEPPLKTFQGDGLQPGVDLCDSAGLIERMES